MHPDLDVFIVVEIATAPMQKTGRLFVHNPYCFVSVICV